MKTVVVFFSSASGELADASFMVEAALQRKKSFLVAARTAEGRCGHAVTPQTALAMSFWVAWAWHWPTEPCTVRAEGSTALALPLATPGPFA